VVISRGRIERSLIILLLFQLPSVVLHQSTPRFQRYSKRFQELLLSILLTHQRGLIAPFFKSIMSLKLFFCHNVQAHECLPQTFPLDKSGVKPHKKIKKGLKAFCKAGAVVPKENTPARKMLLLQRFEFGLLDERSFN